MTTPEVFVRNAADRDYFRACIKSLVGDVIIDLNAEIEGAGDDFDYRDKLRDATWVEEITKRVVADYLKQVKRQRITSFKEEWEAAKAKQKVKGVA